MIFGSLALAVGLTPQLLPTIVSISLAQGARAIAKRRVIVRRLDSIEDFGSMSIFCSDKTGTMTAGEVVLDATSFYADSGGQVGDVGWLVVPRGTGGDHNAVVAEVSGATKPVQGVFAHRVRANQTIAVGDVVDTVVDAATRSATIRNHTGTHLLHAALREVLGRHVKQAGSLNDATRLRFDFSHFAGVAEEELREVLSGHICRCTGYAGIMAALKEAAGIN